jgi:hypothetical protein
MTPSSVKARPRLGPSPIDVANVRHSSNSVVARVRSLASQAPLPISRTISKMPD